jgi:hypothetical protein
MTETLPEGESVTFIITSDPETISALKSELGKEIDSLPNGPLEKNPATNFLLPNDAATISAIISSGTLLLSIAKFIYDWAKDNRDRNKSIAVKTMLRDYKFYSDAQLDKAAIENIVAEMFNENK